MSRPPAGVRLISRGGRGTPNMIEAFMHCALCLHEWQGPAGAGLSPRQYAQTEAGFTSNGEVQVWCKRHEVNVVVISVVADPHSTWKGQDDAPTQ